MANRIGLQVENAQLNLAPGETAIVRLSLTNAGNVVDAFTVSVMGLDPSWYTLSAGEAKLFPRQQSVITLKISPPTAGARPLAGFYPFTVLALSSDDPTEQAIAQGMVNLSAVGGLALDLQPRTRSGRQGLYAITLSNGSNIPRSTVLALSDPEEALGFTLGTPSIREGASSGPDVFAPPTNTGYTDSSYVTPPPFGEATAKGAGVLEHNLELPPGSTAVVPVMVKPLKRVWTGKERPFPFSVGAHPPGVEWEANEAQMVEGRLAYKPIFAAWTGMPLAARRALLFLVPLLILACLLFLLLRPQDKPGVSTAQQTQTALALSAAQTQTALALSNAQTMTAVALANGGNVAAANATLTALAGSAAQTQTALAASAQTALAGANASATALARSVTGADGVANIDKFFLKVGDPNATATPIGGGIAGSESNLQYNVSGAMAVNISQQSRPFQGAGLENATVIDFRMVATGTNRLPVTRTLSVLVVRPPMIADFSGAPLVIGPGESTSLLWKVFGAKDVTIDGIPVTGTDPDGNGQIGVQPTGTRRFIMCATNAVGSVCRSVLVTVLPPGAPTPTAAPPTIEPTERPTRVPTTAVPTREPTTPVPIREATTAVPVPTTPVPIVTATTCTEDYTIEEEANATVVPALTPVAGLQCDDCASTVLLPFPFQLYDRVFDRVSVGSNGTLNFASTANPSSTNACLPAANVFNYAIFAHWDNLTTLGANRGVFTRVDGDAPNRIFTIEWRAAYVVANAASGSINFEARLFENAPDQRFEVIYGTITGGGTGATTGVQRDTGTRRTQFSCNTSNELFNGLKLIYTLPCGSGTGERPASCVPGNATVNIQDGKFSPRNLIITQGSIVTWTNLDTANHNVVGPNNLWSSGTLGKGQGFKFTFNTPGVYFYRSTLDQNLTGNITVVVACTPTATPVNTSIRTSTRTNTSVPPSTRTSTRIITGTPPTGTQTRTGTQPTGTATSAITGTSTRGATGTGTSTAIVTPTITPTPSDFSQRCSTIGTVSGSIKAGDPAQVGRVGLYDAPSNCLAGASCLPSPDSLPRRYDSYTFTNNTATEQCITVRVTAPACGSAGVMSVAYLGSFNPNNVCINYLGQGGPPSAQYTYSFKVPAGATYVIVVNEYGPNDDCGQYSLEVGLCVDTPPTTVVPPTRVPPTTVPPTNPPPSPFITNTPPPPQITATRTNTRPPSSTPITPSATRTNTVTSTATNTSTGTATATLTSSVTNTPTGTATSTATNTVTSTATATVCVEQNYSFTYIAPVPSATVIVPATNFVPGSDQNNTVVTATLPISVQLYGQTFSAGSTIYLSDNGNLRFTYPTPDGDNVCLPASGYTNTIFAFWDDLQPDAVSGGGIYTLLQGDVGSRIFYIEWRSLSAAVDSFVNFEIALFEGQDGFDLLYGFMGSSEVFGTVGVQRDIGLFTQAQCNNQSPLDGSVLQFRRPLCGTITPSPTMQFTTSTATTTPTAITPAACGPDSNFTIITNTLTFITATNPVPGMNPCTGPDCTGNIALPFPVPFYDLNATSAVVGDNGILTLSGANPNPPTNVCLPAPSLTYTIFPFWDDLTMQITGRGVFTQVVGVVPNRSLIIEWRAINTTGQTVNFEVALYETPPFGRHSQFDVNFGSVPGNPTVTIGVQKNGTLYTQFICNTMFGSLDHTFFQPGCTTPTITPTTFATSTATSTAISTSTATALVPCAWGTAAPYPTSILDSAVATQGGLLYSFSGMSAGNPTTASYSYNPTTNTWSPLANLLNGISGASAASNGTYIYITGGDYSGGGYTIAQLLRYDPAANTFTTLASSPLAVARHATVHLQGFIYNIAGYDGLDYTAAVQSYNVAANTWATVAPLPQAVQYPMALAYGGYIYVAGGFGGITESLKTYRYDPAANTWNDAIVADMPVTRYGSASAALNNKWIVAGGRSGGATTNTALAYDFSTNTWSSLTNMVAPSERMEGAVVGNRMYVVGGDTTGSLGTTNVQAFQFSPCGGPAIPTGIDTSTPTPKPIDAPIPTNTAASQSVTPVSTSTPTATPTTPPQLGEQCRQWISDGAPVTLSGDSAIETEINVPMSGVVESISVSNLSITKEGAGKLSGYLHSPSAAQVPLFHWVCRQADAERDGLFRWLNLTLMDEGARDVASVYCTDTVKGGLFRPDAGVLEKLRGGVATGPWKLVLRVDPQEVDSVRLESWGLNICATGSTRPANLLVSNTQDPPGSGLDLLFAVLAAALTTVGAPLAWARMRGVTFTDSR